MQRLFTTLALTLALGLSAAEATALGFARVSQAVALGQPLNITVGLKLEAGESFEARCAKAEVNFGERVLPDPAVRVRVETSAAGERRLRITTSVPVDEPVVGVHVHLGCPSSLSRNFMFFADPPGRLPAAADSDEGWQADRGETAVSPVIAAVPSSAQASSPTAARGRPRRGTPATEGSNRTGTSTAEANPQAAPRSAARKRPAAGESRPVLRLDPVEADALILPSLQMDTRLSTPDPAASGTNRSLDPEQAQRLQDQERLKAMEAALLKLRSDSQATERSLTDMQLRLRQADANRYRNPLVYLLAALCAVLGAGLVGMWWLRRRDRATAIWWAGQPDPAAAAPVPAAEAAPPAPMSAPSTFVSELAPLRSPPPVPNFPAAPLAPLPSVPAPSAPVTRLPEPESSVAEPRRPMSAEELIDLEQQAEFFVVLGQDDAAIDLLMGHVRSTGGVSPLPYLKLLEIYRRRGERDPYDRIRERFNRRFNAYAPEWDVDPEAGLYLEGYPEVMNKLQNAWDRPSQAMELLDAALFKRNAGPTFDVPAYRELLFLYGMARDLAERDVGPDGVDLLLPIGHEEASLSLLSSVPASPAAPEPPLDEDIGRFSLDLDVSTDQPPQLSLEDDPHFKRNDR